MTIDIISALRKGVELLDILRRGMPITAEQEALVINARCRAGDAIPALREAIAEIEMRLKLAELVDSMQQTNEAMVKKLVGIEEEIVRRLEALGTAFRIIGEPLVKLDDVLAAVRQCFADIKGDVRKDATERPTAESDGSSAPTPSPTSQWMPIETAPKDGTFMLCCQPSGHINILQYSENASDMAGAGWRKDCYSGQTWKPTHWMLLPVPPQQPKE